MLNDASGFLGAEEEQVEVSIEVKIQQAIASGNKTKIQALGKELQETKLPEYKYAGCTTIQELLEADGPTPVTSCYGAEAGGKNIVWDSKSGSNGSYRWTGGDTVDVNLMSFEGDNNTSFKFDSVTHFTGKLASLQTAQCSLFTEGPIVTFESDMPCLRDGSEMFYSCFELESFTGALFALTNGDSMFQGCSNLTSFKGVLPSLTHGDEMFYKCKLDDESVERIVNSLPVASSATEITIGTGTTTFTQKHADFISTLSSKNWYGIQFQNVTGEVNQDLSSLTNGKYVFYRSSLTSFKGDLSSLTNGYSMFCECSNLTSWNVALPALTNGYFMFQYCTNLTSLDVVLPKLSDGTYMFRFCSKMTTFESDLSSLTHGYCMFSGCTNLTTFESDLSSLTEGHGMFQNCKNLTTFSPFGKIEDENTNTGKPVGKLTEGYYMFHDCKLNLESVKRIAAWLPQRSSEASGTTESSWQSEGWIHIGVGSNVKDSGQDWTDAINTMLNKKWKIVVCVNGGYDTTITA